MPILNTPNGTILKPCKGDYSHNNVPGSIGSLIDSTPVNIQEIAVSMMPIVRDAYPSARSALFEYLRDGYGWERVVSRINHVTNAIALAHEEVPIAN